MVERLFDVLNILAGSCGSIVFVLWIACVALIVSSKHRRDPWIGVFVQGGCVSLVALGIILSCLAYLYVMGVFG